MVGQGRPHLPGNVISVRLWLLALSVPCINLQPKYEHPSSTRFGQFLKLEKIELGALHVSPAAHKENFLHGFGPFEFLFIAIPARQIWTFYLHSLQRYKRFSKLGTHNPYQGSPQRVQCGRTIEFCGYDFLWVINCIRGCILHCFRYIAFDMSNPYRYPSCV